MSDTAITSVLKLENLVFDYINFERLGFKSDSNISYEFKVQIGKNNKSATYKVTLILNGNKEGEYKFSISLSGFFSIDNDVDTKIENDLIKKNTIAILMPYIRSQVSLLTAQPGVESIVLPPININALVDESR